MLPHYVSEYELRQTKVDFYSAKEVSMEFNYKNGCEKTSPEDINWDRKFCTRNMKSYTKYEDFPENEKMFTYEFKHIKTDKIDNFILIGCESDESYETVNHMPKTVS